MSVLLLCKRQCSRKVSTATRGLKRKRFPKEAIFRQTIINNLSLYKLCSVNQNLICHLNFEYGKFEKLTNTPKSHTKKCGKSRIFILLIIFRPINIYGLFRFIAGKIYSAYFYTVLPLV